MALSRELSSLKSQMKEMMTMMKLNFDMTLDIQRSVRQEVSAAIHGAGDEGRQGATGTYKYFITVLCGHKMEIKNCN